MFVYLVADELSQHCHWSYTQAYCWRARHIACLSVARRFSRRCCTDPHDNCSNNFNVERHDIVILGEELALLTSFFRDVVQALYYDQTFLKYLLRGLFAAEQIIVTVLFGIAMPNMKYGVHCVVTSFPNFSASFLYVVSNFTMLFLTSHQRCTYVV
jgi:hypothetical protein